MEELVNWNNIISITDRGTSSELIRFCGESYTQKNFTVNSIFGIETRDKLINSDISVRVVGIYINDQYKFVRNTTTITATTEKLKIDDLSDVHHFIEDVDEVLAELSNMKLGDPISTIENIEGIIGKKFKFKLQVY